MSDLRFVLRVLARTPGFTLTVVLALAVGIGATTAIFSLVNGVLLRPLPYADANRLVMVWQDFTARGGPSDEWASPGNVRDWARQPEVLSSVAAIGGWTPAALFDGQQPETLAGEQVTHGYFATLGLSPAAGRSLEARDDVPGAARVVMIGHGMWQTRFGGDRGVIGRTLTLAGEPHEVIGVAPAGTRGVLAPDAEVWRPLRLNLAAPTYGSVFLRVVGRLAGDITFEGAQGRLTTIARTLEAQEHELRQQGIRIQPAQEWIVGDARTPLLVLLSAVCTLLLLTVANVANLLLARASARDREMSIRAAIGASRGDLVRLLILESLVLSAAGGLLGAIFAAWGLDALLTLSADFLPRAGEVALDGRVLAFTAALSAVTGLLFGLVPAAQSSRPDLQTPLRESGRSTSRKGQMARSSLVIAQVALALVMLVSAGLIVRSFSGLSSADLGFNPDGVATGRVALGGAGYRTAPQVTAFLKQLEERLPSLPGAASTAFTSVLPLSPGGDSDTGFTIAGQPNLLPNGRPRVSWYRSVSTSYFETIGMRMAHGRAPRPAAPEMVVNESFARHFFSGADPIGQQIVADTPPLTIVGVVADAKTRGPRSDTRNEMFIPYQFMPEGGYAIVVRAHGDAAAIIPSLRALVTSIEPRLPLTRPTTMRALQADALAQPRLLATLLGAFASAALLLALLGIYGVIAFAVGQRTTEMGIRLALGATPRQVVGLVLGNGLKLGAIGLALGLAGGLAAAKGIGTLLFGIAPRDPATFAAAGALILATVVLGSWLPARRASRIAPTEALRS
ncbi:MAG: ABC transporter permease [Acidobacteriota bacterium]|nr:ABC transporter permease [Acidobacteriota bacterium]